MLNITVAFPLSVGLMTISVRLIRVWRVSLSNFEILSPILEGLEFNKSLLRSCMNSSSPRSLSLLGVQVLFFLKELGSEMFYFGIY